MFIKAVAITGVIFIPMITINTVLINTPEPEQLNLSTFAVSATALLAFILFCAILIRTSAGKK
jgi:hypothetical protein